MKKIILTIAVFASSLACFKFNAIQWLVINGLLHHKQQQQLP